MADPKEAKVTRVDTKPVPSDKEGLVTSWVTESAELAERAAATTFGIIRDVRGEINQRVLGTLAWLEGSQQGLFKLLRGVDDRVDKLAEDAIYTVENVTLGVIRTVRDTGHGVTDLASNFTKSREASTRAA